MKNIQVIDGADNCAYDIYQVDDDVFFRLFPVGADICFYSDLLERFKEPELVELLQPVWGRRCLKKDVVGIHGTLFYELDFKKKYYPTRRDEEMVTGVGN